jgi:hypothetical protein
MAKPTLLVSADECLQVGRFFATAGNGEPHDEA